ncbi:uncharacterized protein LOC124124353 [Haliotis rufescens]|uniref:uncharacterized protein LOC124124353 n=1 Tax=Haliotis rufescens TaxID=6454 RepID=UPI00201F3AD3|nr:uncharacterized protein LOC124124353 [Haliotis rufescens]
MECPCEFTGANFMSRMIKELCSILGISQSRTTPYHPMCNGMTERFNRTLLNMLGTLKPDQKYDWKGFVGPLVHAYNATRHESTGYSPFYLMFGREARLPIDLAFGIEINKDKQTLTSYVKALKTRLEQSYKIATSASREAQKKQKTGYDVKARGATVQSGDRVLVKILAFEGKHKLSDKWEEDPYIVLSQPNLGIPVFVVKKENGEGRNRTLHRNLLLPIGSLPVERIEEEPTAPTPGPENPKVPETETETSVSDQDERGSISSLLVELPTEPDDDDTTVINAESLERDSTSQLEGDDLTTGEVGSHSSGGDGHMPRESENPGTGEADAREEEAADANVSEEQDTDPVVGATAPVPSDDRPRPRPKPPPRKSLRQRRPPEWQRSGDYVMSQTTSEDRDDRTQLIEQLAAAGIFERIGGAMSQLIVTLLNNTSK